MSIQRVVLVPVLLLCCALPSRAADMEDHRKEIAHELTNCAAYYSLHKLCLFKEGYQSQLGGERLVYEVEALNLVESAAALLQDKKAAVDQYTAQLEALRTSINGSCANISLADTENLDRCTAFAQARDDERNPGKRR